MIPSVTATVDASKLNRALAVAIEHTKPEKLGKIVCSTAYHVVKRTQELTDLKSASPFKIATELGTAVALIPKKRGTGFLTAKRSQRYVSGRMVNVTQRWKAPIKPQSVPLAALIVNMQVIGRHMPLPSPAAQAYHRRTNFRWKRPASPFYGRTRESGRSAMRAAVHRLTAGRFSSTKYLVAGWSEVRKLLLPHLYSGTPATDAGAGANGLGRIAISHGGSSVTVEIANMVGTKPGKKGDNTAAHNAALHKYSGPALQQAIDEEAESKMAYYAAKYHREALLPAWNAA